MSLIVATSLQRHFRWLAIILLCGPGFAAGAAAQDAAVPPKLAVLQFSFLDTSGEPRNQAAEHDARLRAMSGHLRSELDTSGLFDVIEIAEPLACAAGDSECLLAHLRHAGAELVLTGAVHKVSTLISEIWLNGYDVETGKRVFDRSVNFRGDNDEAWRRAAEFLVDQIEASPPAPERP